MAKKDEKNILTIHLFSTNIFIVPIPELKNRSDTVESCINVKEWNKQKFSNYNYTLMYIYINLKLFHRVSEWILHFFYNNNTVTINFEIYKILKCIQCKKNCFLNIVQPKKVENHTHFNIRTKIKKKTYRTIS